MGCPLRAVRVKLTTVQGRSALDDLRWHPYGRGMRRSRREIEQLVIEAAIDLVQSEGMGIGLEGITYTRVFNHLEETTGQRVTRASVHERVWRDQAAFQAAVRDRIAAAEEIVIDLRALDEATDLARVALLDDADPRIALGAVMRRLASIDLTDQPNSMRQANVVIKALVALSDERDQAATADSVRAFRAGHARRIEILTGSYARVLRRLGAQVKPDRGIGTDEAIALIVRAVDGLAEGQRIRAPFDAEGLDHAVVRLDGGPTVDWPLTSIVGFAMIETFFDLPAAPVRTT